VPTKESVFSKEDVFSRLDKCFKNSTQALENNNEDLANFILHRLLNQVVSLANTTLLTPEEAVLFLRTIFIQIKGGKLKFLPDLIQEVRALANVTSLEDRITQPSG